MTEVFHQLCSFSGLPSTSMQSGLNSFFPRDCKHLILVNLSLPNTLLYREQVCPREGGSLSLCNCCHPTRIVTFFHSVPWLSLLWNITFPFPLPLPFKVGQGDLSLCVLLRILIELLASLQDVAVLIEAVLY